MTEIQLGVIEARYADMIWEREPVTSSELVKLTAVAFNWKRTTAHNVLRRLCNKGLFQNNNGTVTSLISRQEFYALQWTMPLTAPFRLLSLPLKEWYYSGTELALVESVLYYGRQDEDIHGFIQPRKNLILKMLNRSVKKSCRIYEQIRIRTSTIHAIC